MAAKCKFVGCHKTTRKSGVKMFKFPKDQILRDLWIQRSKNENVVTMWSVVCSDHFDEKYIRRLGRYTYLLPGAVPKMNTYLPSTKSTIGAGEIRPQSDSNPVDSVYNPVFKRTFIWLTEHDKKSEDDRTDRIVESDHQAAKQAQFEGQPPIAVDRTSSVSDVSDMQSRRLMLADHDYTPHIYPSARNPLPPHSPLPVRHNAPNNVRTPLLVKQAYPWPILIRLPEQRDKQTPGKQPTLPHQPTAQLRPTVETADQLHSTTTTPHSMNAETAVNKTTAAPISDSELLRRHISMKCNVCGVQCESFSAVRQHHWLVHGKGGFLVCCDRKFFNESRALMHCRKWHQPQSNRPAMVFECYHCHMKYKWLTTLQHHLRDCHPLPEELNLDCAHCDQRFASVMALRRHQNRYHEKQPTYRRTPLLFVCDVCGKEFKKKIAFDLHQSTQHSVDGGESMKAQCPECGLWLKHVRRLRAHMMKHSAKPAECPDCGKMTPNPAALYQHRRLAHMKGVGFACEKCGKRFMQKHLVANHLRDCGSSRMRRDYTQCAHCPFHGRDLKAHMQAKHPEHLQQFELDRLDRQRASRRIYIKKNRDAKKARVEQVATNALEIVSEEGVSIIIGVRS